MVDSNNSNISKIIQIYSQYFICFSAYVILDPPFAPARAAAVRASKLPKACPPHL
jgi:hypothetical protein